MQASSSPKAALLSNEAGQALFFLARQAIERWLDGTFKEIQACPHPELTQPFGLFVTLMRKGALRGCIGQIFAAEPVFRLVEQAAISSASRDPRFLPLTKAEWADTRVQVSVVSPLERLESLQELEIGRHGIFVKKGLASGVYLPEVAVEAKWNAKEFVRHCAVEKAGIEAEDLDEVEVYVFTTQLIEER